MIPIHWSPIANHLWQSTLFAVVALLLTLTLANNRAKTRYWIWLAASVKFLIPFSMLVSVGSLFQWRSAPAVAPPLSAAVEQISQPFTIAPAVAFQPAAFPILPTLLGALWLCGCVVVLAIWCNRWRRIHSALLAAAPLDFAASIPVLSSPTLLEPGVFGIFRPVLLLPQGIVNRLTPKQFRAILAHELCHVRRRDNLAAAVHMMVEAIFWFHPLVWWIGARLIAERERACDEEVLFLGNEPQAYAEGILNVCKFYLESPLACASGVTGSDLKKRIEAIMTDRISHKLTLARKLLLATAGMAAVTGPILIGVLNSPHSQAQSKPEPLTFEVASIKPSNSDTRQFRIGFTSGGGLNLANVTLNYLIVFAYDIRCGKDCDNFISGAPQWADSQRYDIIAKAPQSAEANADIEKMTADHRKSFHDRSRQRLQALLAERFQLLTHRETKEKPVYALVVAKNGPKLKEASTASESSTVRGERGHMIAENITMQFLAVTLAGPLGRPLLDQTGLKGRYDLTLDYAPDNAVAADHSGPSIFTALQEQLGLRVESTRGPVEVIVIDRAERPAEN